MRMLPRLLNDSFYFDDVFDNLMFHSFRDSEFNHIRCDIYEKDGIYHLEMDIPGFNKEDIHIDVDDNHYLTISATKDYEEDDDSDKNYVRRERSYGKYQRSFYVGNLDVDKIDASFENGILKISIPKKEDNSTSNRKIDIK